MKNSFSVDGAKATDLLRLLSQLESGHMDKVKKRPIAMLSADLFQVSNEFDYYQEKKMKEAERIAKAANRQIEEIMDAINERKEKMWDKIYEELKISPSGTYYIDNTGVVVEKVPVEE